MADTTDQAMPQAQTGAPWSFERILDLHDRAKQAGLIDNGTSLPDFARQLNDLSGSSMFNAGLNDSKVKRFSVGVDKAIEKTGLPDVSADFFGGIGKMISPDLEQTGRKIGKDFPRGTVDTMLTLGGLGLTAAPGGAVVGLPMVAVGAGDTFAKSYTDTGSPAAGVISAGAQVALPSFMKYGAELVSPLGRALTDETASTIINGASTKFPVSKVGAGITERLVDFLGMNLGAAANQELARQATSLAVSHDLVNPFTKEHAFEMGVGLLPMLPFEARNIAKGPGAGEVRSFVELSRLKDAEAILNKASQENSERNYLNTAEKSKMPVQDDYVGGEMQYQTTLADQTLQAEDVYRAEKEARMNRQKTIMGQPIETVSPTVDIPDVPLLTPKESVDEIMKMGPDDFTKFRQRLGPATQQYQRWLGEEVGPEDLTKQIATLDASLGTKPTDEAGLNANMANTTKRQFLNEALNFEKERIGQTAEDFVKAAEVATATDIKTPEDLGAAAKLVNEGAKLNGDETPVVTDADIKAKVEENVKDGLSLDEGVDRANQAVQNRLNRTAGEVQERMTKAEQTSQKANEDLTTLPENAQNVIGKAITKLSKEQSAEIDTDVSDAWTRASVKWAQDPKNAAVIEAAGTPEGEAAAVGQLAKTLGGVSKNKTLERSRVGTNLTGGARSIFSDEVPGSLVPEVERLSSSGQEAFGDTVKTENKLIQDKGEQLTGKVTLEEVKPFKANADQKYADRLSSVIDAFAQGNIERAFNKGKWKFTYHNMEELKAAFGKVSNKTIMDFVKDNYETIGQVLQKRLGTNLMTFGRAGDHLFGLGKSVIKGMGDVGSFPVTTRSFFIHHFLNRGLPSSEAFRLADIATKIAAAYKEINPTRIASLVGTSKVLGVSINTRPESELAPRFGVIGINELNSFAKGTNGALETFLKLHVLAHEVFHSMVNAWKAGQTPDEKSMAISKAYETAADMEKPDKFYFIKDLMDLTVPRQLKNTPEGRKMVEDIANNAAESDDEFLATYSALATLSMVSPSGFKGNATDIFNHLYFGDKHLTDFVHSQYLDLLDLTGAIQDLFHARGDVAQAKWVGTLNDAYKKMYASKQEIEDTVSKLRYFDNMSNGGLRDIITRNAIEPIRVLPLPKEYGGAVADFMSLMRGTAEKPTGKTSEDLLGKKLNFYEKNLVPVAQIAEMYPITRPVINLGFTFGSVKNKFVTMALRPFMTPDKYGRLVFDEEHSGLSKVLGSESLNDAFSQVALLQNENERQATADEIGAIAKQEGLSSEETDILHQTVANTSTAMESMSTAMIQSRKELIGIMAGRILLDRAEGSVNAQQAHAQGKAFVDALLAASGKDPQAAAQGAAALAEVQKTINNPEAFDAVTKAVTGILPKFVDFANQISGKPWYTPEVRLGKFSLSWLEGGERHFVKVADQAAFEKRLAELNKNPNVDQTSIKGAERFDQNNDKYLLGSDMVQKFAAIEQSAFETIRAMFPDDAATLDKLGYVPGEAAFKEVTAQGIGKYTLKRNLVAGREEINMMEGVLDYVTGVSGGLAKGYTRNLAALYLADPTMKANPQVAAFLRDHIQSVTSSQKEWQSIKDMVFHFTLGGNLSSILVERLQPLFTLVPHLVQNGASIAGSYSYMGRAMKSLWQIAAGDTSALDPKLQIPEMLKRASQDKVIDFGVYQELASQEDVGTLNLRNLAIANAGVNSATNLLSKPLFWYTRFARNVYTKAATQNNRVAFLSSYLMAMEKGVNGKKLTPDEAYQFATDSVHTTMFGGGKAGRPVGMFSNLGKSYSAVSAWYMLQHYTTSSIAMMYRLLKDSLGKTGLEPSQVSASRKALGQMVLTQTLMSGTLGLPLVGGTLGILEQIFPNLEAKKKIRETLAGLAGDDHQMGELLADSFLHGGLPRALGLGMVDLSGRFGLGNVFGISPEYGFDPASVFGAPGSVFGNILKATGSAAQGEVGQALEQAAPTGWRNMIRMYNDDWNVRDSAGRLIFEPTTTESILGAIGFQPKRLSEFREQQRLLQRSNDVETRELQRFHGDLADLLLQGQPDQVRALLLQRHQEDSLYDPRAGLHAVVQLAQDKSVPIDPNRGGRASLDERQKIADTFSSVASRPSEVQLLMQGKQMERSVGIAGAGTLSRHELTIAQMVDQMLTLNPTMGRQMARALVEKQLAHGPARL